MSRSRTLTAGRAALMAAGSIAATAALFARRDRHEAITPQELERRTKAGEGPTRSQRRQVKKAAVRELVQASSMAVVLGHIQPRWLRDEVERRLCLGETITADRIDELRAMGRPHGS